VVFDKAALPRFGIMHDFRRPSGDPSTTAEYYAQCLAEAAEADRLGYDMVWLSEHHFTDDGMLPSPLVAAAAVAARTSHIGIGTNVLVLPLHHPLRVAEDAAVVDLISGGRLVLAVGQGYAPAEFAGFGVDRTHRPGRLEEGISVLPRLGTMPRSRSQDSTGGSPAYPYGRSRDAGCRCWSARSPNGPSSALFASATD
jgi:alkanesulfonate monooxygenase SsuD/methylene tetrahydromethanopterin reductase-like flavin-dependent oxidoreductase (luciferase family)